MDSARAIVYARELAGGHLGAAELVAPTGHKRLAGSSLTAREREIAVLLARG